MLILQNKVKSESKTFLYFTFNLPPDHKFISARLSVQNTLYFQIGKTKTSKLTV